MITPVGAGPLDAVQPGVRGVLQPIGHFLALLQRRVKSHRAATLPAGTPDHPFTSVADVLSLLELASVDGSAVRRLVLSSGHTISGRQGGISGADHSEVLVISRTKYKLVNCSCPVEVEGLHQAHQLGVESAFFTVSDDLSERTPACRKDFPLPFLAIQKIRSQNSMCCKRSEIVST